MNIETTININESVKTRLNYASDLTGVSRSQIIVSLMRKLMSEKNRQICSNIAVRYQKKTRKGKWVKTHVTLFSRDYEYFLDMRKFYKMSVSAMVAIATKKFLNGFLANMSGDDKNSESTDNCSYLCHFMLTEMVDEVICWKIFWGAPLNHDKFYAT